MFPSSPCQKISIFQPIASKQVLRISKKIQKIGRFVQEDKIQWSSSRSIILSALLKQFWYFWGGTIKTHIQISINKNCYRAQFCYRTWCSGVPTRNEVPKSPSIQCVQVIQGQSSKFSFFFGFFSKTVRKVHQNTAQTKIAGLQSILTMLGLRSVPSRYTWWSLRALQTAARTCSVTFWARSKSCSPRNKIVRFGHWTIKDPRNSAVECFV